MKNENLILSAHQPAYLPWLGYFDKIARSDVFIYLDQVQFEKNSYTNRNRIKGSNGEIMLTVPVLSKGHLDKTIAELEIDNLKNWRSKHVSSIRQSYSKARYFEQYASDMEEFYRREWVYISDFCYEMLLWFLDKLSIKTKIIKQSSLGVGGQKQDLILNLCKHFDASHFIFGKLGQNYVDQSLFTKNNISISFQDYTHPTYTQLYNEFLPFMSILDLLTNEGPSSTDILLNKHKT